MTTDSSGSRSRSGLLASTAAIALVTGICALGLVHHLSRMVEKPDSRLAALPLGIVDPETTGSLGPAARSVVLDPCNGNQRLVVRGP